MKREAGLPERAGSHAEGSRASESCTRAQVCVLLATYNGMPWLTEQLDSLSSQDGVEVSVIVSDDRSTDSTLREVSIRLHSGHLKVLPSHPRFGNANRNFMRLVRDAPIGSAGYVALADQDDIWMRDKLQRAIGVLKSAKADAYSSDVIAFWPDGRSKPLGKGSPQRRFDHLFESAGPGCTFVFTRACFLRIRAWVQENYTALQEVKVHDWVLYAYVREQRWRWVIDPQPGLRYRQHDRNELGANVGWRAALVRLRQVLSGPYWNDVLKVCEVTGATGQVPARLRRMSVTDRLWLAMHARDFRRRLPEALLLSALFLICRRH